MSDTQILRLSDDMAKDGLGVSLYIVDGNGHSSFYFPFDLDDDDIDTAESLSATVLQQVAIWLAENGYLPTSDRKGVICGGAA